MSKAWLDRGRLHIQCDACSSTGTAGGQLTLDVPDDVRAAQIDFGKRVVDVVQKFQRGTAALKFDTKKTDDEKRAAFAEMQSEARAAMQELLANRPDTSRVSTVLEKCPWCGTPLGVAVEKGANTSFTPPPG